MGFIHFLSDLGRLVYIRQQWDWVVMDSRPVLQMSGHRAVSYSRPEINRNCVLDFIFIGAALTRLSCPLLNVILGRAAPSVLWTPRSEFTFRI